jgi:hypothetical protein
VGFASRFRSHFGKPYDFSCTNDSVVYRSIMLTPVGIRGAVPRVLGRYVPSVLGAVWVAAAWAKIIHPDETLSAFRGSFADLGLNTVAGTRWLLVALIAGELCLGFGLIFEIAPKRMVVMSACSVQKSLSDLG